MKNHLTQQRFADRVSNVPQSFIREILKVAADPSFVSFAGGLPNPAYFPIKELEASAAKVFQTQGAQALQYTTTEGVYGLREFISNRYRKRHQLDIPPEQILITTGSQQALDLIGKILINPGDEVLLERPTYLGALQCLSMFQPSFKEVLLENDGININELEQQLMGNSIKLFYGIPNFQNPTGIQYNSEKRKLAANLFSKHNTIVIEDDPYGEIHFDDQPLPLLYYYIPDQTILLGSFSKTIAPGLRLGWMVASKDTIQKATIMKQASDLHSGNLAQCILMQFLTDYDFDTHVDKIKNAYRLQRTTMLTCIEDYFPKGIHFTKPEGGMFTWLKLPEYITARELLEKSIREKIVFVPGDTFYASAPDTQTLRINYSNVATEKMKDAMRILGGLI